VISNLIDDYPRFVVIEYHLFDPYATPWGDERADFHGANLFPWFTYDGLFDAWPIDSYEGKLQQRLAVATDVTLALTGVEQGPDSWQFTAEVCVEAGGTGKDMRIYMVQVLDHWPVTPSVTYSRNTFRQAAAEEDVNVAAGECASVVRSFTFDATSMAQPQDIKVAAWAQEPLGGIPAAVHQAAIIAWPFAAPPFFADGFESGDTAGWSATVP
jgi:hypothetical protein